MKKMDVSATESFLVDNQSTHLSEELISRLYEFLNKSYHLADQEEFQLLVMQPEKKGELTVLFGENNEIAGFSRTYSQSMKIGKKQVTTYICCIYINPMYKACPTIASAGLTQAIKYKLSHPHEELIYVAFANNPSTYEFIYQLSDFTYPKPSQRVPDQILTIINALKKQNGWISTNNHPMVINSPLVPLRSQTPTVHYQNSELSEFYIEANPDYMQGSSLLVYIPLHLANINYGLNHMDFIEKKKQHHQSGYHEGDSPLQKVQ